MVSAHETPAIPPPTIRNVHCSGLLSAGELVLLVVLAVVAEGHFELDESMIFGACDRH